MIALLHHGWHRELRALVNSAKRRLVIAAPFIGADGSRCVVRSLSQPLRESGRLEILTDLSPMHVADGSLAPEAVVALHQAATTATLWHIPRLHAKVYIADDARAIVTSGNLSAAAFFRNIEYGIGVDDRGIVATIQSHFDDYRATGTAVGLDDLVQYARIAADVRVAWGFRRKSADHRLTEAFQSAVNEAANQLIRLRLAGGAMHTVFARTIEYLLKKYGALRTMRLHELVQALHPELCDDSVDRVIDGRHYGKKWKHAVRTAQQQLKRAGVVEYTKPLWRLAKRN